MKSVLTKQELEALYIDQKLSSIEIATKLGVAVPTVSGALRRLGIPRRSLSGAAQNRREQTYSQDWESLKERYESGENLEALAQETGCSPSTAAVHLRRVGTKIRPRGSESTTCPNPRGRIDIDIDKAIELNQAGATLTEISVKLPNHPSIQVISKRLRDAGYTVLVHKASTDPFKNVQVKKREVARAIDASRCAICEETRGIQLGHIQSRRKGGALNPDNALPLCPGHHWFFDHGLLSKQEVKKIKPLLLTAASKGYTHHVYGV